MLDKIGDVDSTFNEILKQATSLIVSCYGFKEEKDLTTCRIKSWFSKTGKARKTAPKLETLPPTPEAFKENVKRGHLQVMVWKSTTSQEPPKVDFLTCGWFKEGKTLKPVGIPVGVESAPSAILKGIKCSCSSDTACSSSRYSCYSAGISCTMICKCNDERHLCFNPRNKVDENESDAEEEN